MEKLIEALQIFLKYGNPDYPTHCEHDELTVDINPDLVSSLDKIKLEDLGFYEDEDSGDFKSIKYGSC